MDKRWHGTVGKYSGRDDAVRERRVKNFIDYNEAHAWLLEHKDSPVYIWHDEAVNLDNPYFAIIETIAYQNEHKKIVNR